MGLYGCLGLAGFHFLDSIVALGLDNFDLRRNHDDFQQCENWHNHFHHKHHLTAPALINYKHSGHEQKNYDELTIPTNHFHFNHIEGHLIVDYS